MIVKIPRREKEVVEKVLAMIDMKGNFYTIENNANLVLFEIEASPETIWGIARCVQSEINCQNDSVI